MKEESKYQVHIIQVGIVAYWFLFWLLNVVDKLIEENGLLWVGTERLNQFIGYFNSIGVEDPLIAAGVLSLVTFGEVLAMIFLGGALWRHVRNDCDKAESLFFWGTFSGLVVFSFFTIGDQIFGDRVELLEHTIYWIALVVSWGAYKYYPLMLKGEEGTKRKPRNKK